MSLFVFVLCAHIYALCQLYVCVFVYLFISQYCFFYYFYILNIVLYISIV